jgi:putative ABC transport system permease protein
MTLVVRAAGDPLALAGPIRAEVGRMDRHLPIAAIRPMTEVVETSMATTRFTGFLLALFAALALTLSAIGIYGVLSYLVSQRTREIGIRLAVGAGRGQVLRMILSRGLVLSLAGIAAGLVAAFAMTRLMTTLLHGVAPTDAATFGAVAAGLGAIAAGASAIPALRATRVDPLVALRSE